MSNFDQCLWVKVETYCNLVCCAPTGDFPMNTQVMTHEIKKYLWLHAMVVCLLESWILATCSRICIDSWYQIGPEGGRLIGDMLKNNGSLQELSLNSCGLGDMGLIAITFGKYTRCFLERKKCHCDLRSRCSRRIEPCKRVLVLYIHSTIYRLLLLNSFVYICLKNFEFHHCIFVFVWRVWDSFQNQLHKSAYRLCLRPFRSRFVFISSTAW